MELVDAIQTSLADEDRYVTALVPLDEAHKLQLSSHVTERGMICRVYEVREIDEHCFVRISGEGDSAIWVMPIEVTHHWDLCDGCHAPISQCCCDELAADRAEEYGPWCDTCGCDGDTDYGSCVYRLIYSPGSCPMLTGTF